MSRFDDCLAYVLKSEGYYSDDKADHGGATKWGVTQASYDRWRAKNAKTLRHVRDMEADERDAIYFEDYWMPGKCGQMPVPLDYVHFDGCVNHGVGQANKFVQRALGVAADGDIGPQSIRALQEDIAAGKVDDLTRSVLDQRRSFYHHLAENDPSQERFLNGWLNRLDSISHLVLG